ncbi:MAG: glycerate kinase [Oscillibacter sp.]|nr:glycerate kinase [Oscillibacter sp.]
MNQTMRQDAYYIIGGTLKAVLPDEAVRRVLENRTFPGRVVLAAAGKAAWQMARAAQECLGDQLNRGVAVTKYGHGKGFIPRVACYEGGHPVPDEGSFRGTEAVLAMVEGLTEEDTVLFLLSGGGSALFEKPRTSPEVLQDVTNQLLACGADVVEINTIRKRLSGVKGGRFAQLCAPARVFSIVLSDVLGDPLDAIASGPAYPDRSTCAQARAIAEKYRLTLPEEARLLLDEETPKALDNVETHVTGSVGELCRAAASLCGELGYEPLILTDRLCCQAREAGSFLASIARTHGDTRYPLAFLAGGETVVRLTGTGKGGRNQELALSAASGIDGMSNVLLFSLGSDGTDGPTDAAGGIVDGSTAGLLRKKGVSIHKVLEENDAYHALQQANSLLVTGPTGTNVNDVAVVLIRRKDE